MAGDERGTSAAPGDGCGDGEGESAGGDEPVDAAGSGAGTASGGRAPRVEGWVGLCLRAAGCLDRSLLPELLCARLARTRAPGQNPST